VPQEEEEKLTGILNQVEAAPFTFEMEMSQGRQEDWQAAPPQRRVGINTALLFLLLVDNKFKS